MADAPSTRQTERTIDDADESVLIAIRALGDMRTQRIQETVPETSSSLMTPSSTPPAAGPSQNSTGKSREETASPPGGQFVSRVSTLPIVNSALRAYEHGKNSSRVVKYGAEMVESGIQTLSRPVIERLPTNVVNFNTLDEFACRQLDRFDRYRHPLSADESSTPGEADPPSIPHANAVPHNDDTSATDASQNNSFPDTIRPDASELALEELHETLQNGSSRRHHSPSTQPGASSPEGHSNPNNVEHSASDQQAVVQRSRWHTVLSEAGGLGAALSEESMKRLKYCLQWLLYATTHIDAQILVLRDFIAQLQPLPPGDAHSPSSRARTSDSSTISVSHAHMRTLNSVRRDIVHTIRQVVDVVSKYAGGALPEPARASVRGFILKLPQRWATRTSAAGSSSMTNVPHGEGSGVPTESVKESREGREREREERQSVAAAAAGGAASRRSSRASKRLQQRERGAASESNGASSSSSNPASTLRSHPTSPVHSRPTSPMTSTHNSVGANAMSPGAAVVAAQRILTLATESLDMMRGVTGVLKDSLDRADAWVGRLRAVGIQRTGPHEDGDFGRPVPIDENGEAPSISDSSNDLPSSSQSLDSSPLQYASGRRGSLPSTNLHSLTPSYNRPPSLSQSFASYSVADINVPIQRHQSFPSLPNEHEYHYDYSYRIPPSSSAAPSSRSSSIAALTRNSVPSTPGSAFGSSQVASIPATPTEGDFVGDVNTIASRFRNHDDGDMDGEANRMSMMSIASRRGSLADLLLAVDAAEGISGGVGTSGTQPGKSDLIHTSHPPQNSSDGMDVDP